MSQPTHRVFSCHITDYLPMGNGCSGKGMGHMSMMGKSRLGNDVIMVMSHDGGTNDFLDDGFTKNWVWYFIGDWYRHMHGGRHFNDLFNVFDHIIRYFVWFFYVDGLVHSVNFFLNMDDGGVVGHGTFQSSGHSNFEVGDGWFQNLCGIPSNVCGLPEMHLLSDDGFWFVDDGLIGKFLMGEVGCGKGGCDF